MALPSLGNFTAASPAMQKFLKDHPTFARMTGVAQRQKFLDNHPEIRDAYQAIINPQPATSGAAAAATPAAAAAAPTATTSAKAVIEDYFAQRGLPGLGNAAWSRYLELGGDSNPDAYTVLYQELKTGAPWSKGAYAARYPGIRPGQTEQEYRDMEDGFRQTMRAYGLPPSFYDSTDDFAKLIKADVSPKEFDDRVAYAAQVVATDPRGQQLRDQLSRLYGFNNADGLAVAYWIDPDKGSDLIKRQFLAGEAAASSQRVGFGSLTQSQAETIAASGAAPQDAENTLSSLADLGELRTASVGDAGSTAVSQDDMIAAAFNGDSAAKKKLQREQQRRVSAFDGGGSYAAGSSGVTGLGSAGG